MIKKSLLLAAGVAALLVAGCDSSGLETRIQEKSAVFNALAPWQQRDVRNGVVSVGDSTDVVYITLGKPSKIVTSADGRDTTWTFNNYYPPSATSHAQSTLNPGQGANYRSTTESNNVPRGGKSLSDTSTRGSTQSNLDVAEVPSDTLYVIFRDGVVFQTKLESENQ